MQTNERLSELVGELREEKQALVLKQESLEAEIRELQKQLVNSTHVTKPVSSIEVPRQSSEPDWEEPENRTTPVETSSQSESGETSDSSSSREDSSERTRRRPRHHSTQTRIRDPHPLGFKTLIHRVEKFSGRKGDNDFEIWLMDFKEATEHCGWNDEQRAKWFSWFLSGPAKATWQCTLKDTDKTSWQKIVEIYCGQYGVHLDPCIAYQKCQELQYSQFGSAQGLLDAMRDYQRMAPEKLSDATVESILWNKVPIALQQELKEIPDGSVQELLQRLLRAEATLKERERRTKGIKLGLSQRLTFNSNRSPSSGPGRGSNNDNAAEKSGYNTSSSNTNSHDQQQREMSLKTVKCYNCHKKGHLAKDCPTPRGQRTSSTRRIATGSGDTTEQQDLWLRTVTAKTDQQLKETTVAARGPTYKVDIVVDGVRTRALLDHGAQVSLARKQLLPVIKELEE